ncbi:MAG: D-aminoacylase [Armatimonadetes bacterium]|nr:D-aminoacylase [Armatimonadota bacterium]MDW8120722.1 D-aminoacylase [Armatimonadota bacterium]
MIDWLIVNGQVIDGTGNPPQIADLAIVGDRIQDIGLFPQAEARQRIDASGKLVIPGFIDVHTHYDVALLHQPHSECAISQGVTTVVVGNCGHSPVPIPAHLREPLRATLPVIDDGKPWRWSSFGEYLGDLERSQPAVNVVALVGHCALRASVVGFDDRSPSEEEMKQMETLLEHCIDEGAWGLSTGLVYPPGAYAGTDELVRLCRIVAKKSAIYATHMRNESDQLVSAVVEALHTALRSGVRLQISHHKAARRANWGKVEVTLRLIETAALTHPVAFDAYPYTAGSANLSQFLPHWAHEGGPSALLARLSNPDQRQKIRRALEEQRDVAWDEVRIASVASEESRVFEGKSVAAIADEQNLSPEETVLYLIEKEKNAVTMVHFVMDERDVETVMTHPLCMVGSDALTIPPPLDSTERIPKVHPRTYGTFPKFLRWLVKEKKRLGWSDAIAKATSVPARHFAIPDRGTLEKGKFADIVVLDPQTIGDRSTYEDPAQLPSGIDWVFVNGRPVVRSGIRTEERCGKVLRWKGS